MRLSGAAHLLDRYRAFAIDLDGVVWRGERFLDGALDGLRAIRQRGKPFILLTNNGAYTPQDVVARLGHSGITIHEGQVLTSAVVARQWIEQNNLTGAAAFILGGPPVVAQLEDVVEVKPVAEGEQVRVVLVGRDEEFSYERMRIAADAIRAGASFICLNRDPVMPVEDGRMVPGTGSIVAALQTASGGKPIIMGKPELPMMKAGAAVLGLEKVLMLGDRLESDILGGRRIGWDTALVLTGLDSEQALKDSGPDYVLSSLEALATAGGDSGGEEDLQGALPI